MIKSPSVCSDWRSESEYVFVAGLSMSIKFYEHNTAKGPPWSQRLENAVENNDAKTSPAQETVLVFCNGSI